MRFSEKVDGHVNCPCWLTGKFHQVPCPIHDGCGKYPRGSYMLSQDNDTLTNISTLAYDVAFFDWGTSCSDEYRSARMFVMDELRKELEKTI
jgi:hypothetical protein